MKTYRREACDDGMKVCLFYLIRFFRLDFTHKRRWQEGQICLSAGANIAV